MLPLVKVEAIVTVLCGLQWSSRGLTLLQSPEDSSKPRRRLELKRMQWLRNSPGTQK